MNESIKKVLKRPFSTNIRFGGSAVAAASFVGNEKRLARLYLNCVAMGTTPQRLLEHKYLAGSITYMFNFWMDGERSGSTRGSGGVWESCHVLETR